MAARSRHGPAAQRQRRRIGQDELGGGMGKIERGQLTATHPIAAQVHQPGAAVGIGAQYGVRQQAVRDRRQHATGPPVDHGNGRRHLARRRQAQRHAQITARQGFQLRVPVSSP